MKKLVSTVAVLGSLLMGQSALATVLTFDDITSDTGGIVGTFSSNGASNYGGLAWSNDWYLMHTPTMVTPSGYKNSTTSGEYIAYNGFAQDVSVTNGTFDFNGVNLTGAWNDGLNIEVQGWLGGSLIYDNTVTVDTSGPTWFDFNYIGIDNLTFSSFGGIENPAYTGGSGTHFAMDDFTFNANAVPEPASIALMGLGLVGLGFSRRKKAA